VHTEPFLRRRFAAIALLGVFLSLLSLAALVYTMHEAHVSRLERARETVGAELDQVERLVPRPNHVADLHKNRYGGIRGGWLDRPEDARDVAAIPDDWRAPLERAASSAGDTRTIAQTELGSSTLVLCVERSAGRVVWTGDLVAPPRLATARRWIVSGLAAGILLLVVLFVRSELLYRRYAEELAASRSDTERLQRELSHNERLAALGRVVAGVAHEVRNPLASIKLRLDLTAASGRLPEGARQSIAAAAQEICRLDRLVSDLLLVAGKKVGPRRPLELGELVRARVQAIGPWAEEQQVSVAAEGTGVAHADPESVTRAVDNVLRNAVEAAPAESTIRATVAQTSDAIELRVEDRGPGVAPTRQRELFEPFFTTKPQGSGLGLAISRSIARAHGGDLVYARAGDVTRFSLSLPRWQGAEA